MGSICMAFSNSVTLDCLYTWVLGDFLQGFTLRLLTHMCSHLVPFSNGLTLGLFTYMGPCCITLLNALTLGLLARMGPY